MHKPTAALICGRRAKYLVVLFWVAVLFGLAPLAGRLADVSNNEAATWLPADAESTKALEASGEFRSPDLFPAVVVYEREGGLTGTDRSEAAADAEAFGELDGSTVDGAQVRLEGAVRGPEVSPDGDAMRTYIPLELSEDDTAQLPGVVESIRERATDDANGPEVHVTGPAGSAADSAAAFEGTDTTLLLATVGVVVLILLLTYRSPALWLLPVVSAGIALMSAQGVIYLLARNTDLTVNGQSSSILTVLVFGAGTDYALLLVARYREELRRVHDRHDAMAEALHRAGPAIVASASTVALGMLCLLVAEMTSTQGLGPVTAIGVVVGVLAMLTLLPALLVIAGRWVFWPFRPHVGTAEPTSSGLWAAVGHTIARRPRAVWIGTALVLAAMAAGTMSLDPRGLTAEESFRGDVDSVAGDAVVAEHFVSESASPAQVVSTAGSAAEVRRAVAKTPGVDAASLADPIVVGDRAFLEAPLTDDAYSDAAYATVDRLRDATHAVPGSDALVGGAPAFNADIQQATQRDNSAVIPLVLAVVFVILMILLRSIVAAGVLIGTVVLSFGAALGVSALVFNGVFGIEHTDSAFPLFVFVFLVALGIDYNIFLMTRVREETIRGGPRRGALVGLSATGGVITSAGLVLAATFAVLAGLPVTFTLQLGFAVAFGVLLDTLVVRSVLVTALNLDLGSRMWWPSVLGLQAPHPSDSADETARTRTPVGALR